MSSCYIISAGIIGHAELIHIEKRCGDIVICADGGIENAEKLGIACDMAVGDFDSSSEKYVRSMSESIMVHPCEKDETDTFLAITKGYEKGFREFVLIGATGGRLDHTWANISLLKWLHEHGAKGKLIDEYGSVYLMYPPGGTVKKQNGFHLSLFSFETSVENIVLCGTKYSIKEKRLVNSFPLGISNEIEAETAEISFDSGCLLVMQMRDIRGKDAKEFEY